MSSVLTVLYSVKPPCLFARLLRWIFYLEGFAVFMF